MGHTHPPVHGTGRGGAATNQVRPVAAFNIQPYPPMLLLSTLLPIAAAGWSLLYLLCGGGLVGAVVIFVVAKLFGK